MAVSVQPQPGPSVNAGSADQNVPAVTGTSLAGGAGSLSRGLGAGTGVVGASGSGTGVAGTATSGTGIAATADSGTGLEAVSDSGTGLAASSASGTGIQATSITGTGLQAASTSGNAIHAVHEGDAATLPDLILAETSSTEHAAVAAHNTGYGAGVWAFSQAGTAVVATNDAPGTADADAFLAATSRPTMPRSRRTITRLKACERHPHSASGRVPTTPRFTARAIRQAISTATSR